MHRSRRTRCSPIAQGRRAGPVMLCVRPLRTAMKTLISKRTRVLVASLMCLGFIVCLTSCFEKRRLIRKGDDLVAAIEAFRAKNQRLPISLAELGIRETEEGPLYYKRTNASDYIVWFGTSLGDSCTYDSARGTWEGDC
jgi:hypothetical protein